MFINEKNSVGKRRNRDPKRKTTTTTKEPDGVLKGTEPGTRAVWTNASEEELEKVFKRDQGATRCVSKNRATKKTTQRARLRHRQVASL